MKLLWLLALACVWAVAAQDDPKVPDDQEVPQIWKNGLRELQEVDQQEAERRRFPRVPWSPQQRTQETTTTVAAAASKKEVNAWALLAFQLSVPIVALTSGTLSCQCGKGKTAGALLIYFGAQTSMNLFVKEVLSKFVISEERGMKGVPAPFLVTGIQQCLGFCLFIMFIALSNLTRRGYKPRILQTPREYLAVCCFSVTFVLNISLNNYSISLLPLSVNLVIRSCLPLATYISQLIIGRFVKEGVKYVSLKELMLMVCGVVCAGVVVWAQSSSKSMKSHTDTFFLGVGAAVSSLFSGALNMVLAGILGTTLSLTPLDSIGYMSIPAALLLAIPSFAYPHAVSSWSQDSFVSPATDFDIIQEAYTLNQGVIVLLLILGPLAFAYNILQVKLVQTLSATHVSFAGNFNKAASIALALLFGIDKLPDGYLGIVNVLALLGNIAAFTAYSVAKERGREPVVVEDEAENVASIMDMVSPPGTFLDVTEGLNSSFRDRKRITVSGAQSVVFPIDRPNRTNGVDLVFLRAVSD